MPLPSLTAHATITHDETWVRVGTDFSARVPRFGDAAAATRMAHPNRDVLFAFEHPECTIGRHGRQVLLMHSEWLGGEEQILVTHRAQEPFALFCLHGLVYGGKHLQEARHIDLSADHLSELQLAVTMMTAVAEKHRGDTR